MGVLDGAEMADIIGIYLLQQVNEFLTSVGEKCYAGLYRDDGLIYVENTNGPLLNRLEKGLRIIFKRNHLKISIEQKGCTVGCTKIWRFHQKITEPSKKLGLTIRRKHANF